MQLEPDRVVRLDHRLREPVQVATRDPIQRRGEPLAVAAETLQERRQSSADRLDCRVGFGQTADDRFVVGRVRMVVHDRLAGRITRIGSELPVGAEPQEALVALEESAVGPFHLGTAAQSGQLLGQQYLAVGPAIRGEHPARHPALAVAGVTRSLQGREHGCRLVDGHAGHLGHQRRVDEAPNPQDVHDAKVGGAGAGHGANASAGSRRASRSNTNG